MNRRMGLTVAVLCILGSGTVGRTAMAADPVPSEAATRKQVDELIHDAADGRATLGLLQRAIDLSISYGAPAWNAGDHDACAKFYAKTAETLCASFDTPAGASDAARPLLKDLRAALDRVGKSTDVDANAWAVRYVFDKAAVAVGLQANRSAAMVALGRQCAARGSFQDAADAYADAAAGLREFRGLPLEQIPIACKYAPFALADALFGQRKYADAAAAVEEGMQYIPDLAAQTLDLRKGFGDPALYRALVADLRAAADREPEDAGIQFLYGYHLYFTDQRPASRPYLERARKLDPKRTGADKLLNPPPSPTPEAGSPPPPAAPPAGRPLPRNGDL